MKKLICVAGILMVLSGVIIGFTWAAPKYRQFKQARGMRHAWGFFEAGDLANASVSARQVLQINPRNVEACRFMAEMAQLARSPSSIDWRRRIVELEPTAGNRLELVACVLRFEHPPYSLTQEVLKEIAPTSAEKVPAFHVCSAELALKLNRFDEAIGHFRIAQSLEPANPLHRLNLAVLELQSTNASTVDAARAELQQLSFQTNVAVLALRALVADGIRINEFGETERISKRLLALPGTTFHDQLQHLTILQRRAVAADFLSGSVRIKTLETTAARQQDSDSSSTTEVSHYLKVVQLAAKTNSISIFAACEWMGRHNLADEALTWLSTLDETALNSDVIRLARANLYLVKADWTELEGFLSKERWSDLEFLRQALLARTAWARDQVILGDARWRNAVSAAKERLGCLLLLLGLADDWERNSEAVLWEINHRFPRETWAICELERRYVANGNTRGLNKLYGKLIENKHDSGGLTNRNEFACTSLLLGVNLSQAYAISRELYHEHPNDVIVASTYAYALVLQGRPIEGLAVFDSFNEQDLQNPPIALYYGMLLAKTGRREQAKRYLQLAEQVHLSPEEKHLLDEAKADFRTN